MKARRDSDRKLSDLKRISDKGNRRSLSLLDENRVGNG